jgi:DNA-binding transcriptional LysR family regulator
MLNLRVLNNLVVLADEANFSRAAIRLGITQPALSRSIAQLEAQCGMRLFDRRRSGVTPTMIGLDLLSKARGVLGQSAGLDQDMMMQSLGEAGRISIGIGPLSAGALLQQLLSESLLRWPMLSVSVSVAPTSRMVERILAADLDFCICTQKTLDPNPALSLVSLAQFRMGYFVRAGHPIVTSSDLPTRDDLARFPRATGRSPTATSPWSANMFDTLGPTLECDDFGVLKQITLRTDAIWLTSERLVVEELASGKIVELPLAIEQDLQQTDIVLVQLRNRTLSPASLQLGNLAREILQN